MCRLLPILLLASCHKTAQPDSAGDPGSRPEEQTLSPDSGPATDTERHTDRPGDSAGETFGDSATESDTELVPLHAVILMIGDGMGPAQVELGGLHAHGDPTGLSMSSLPVQGSLVTASLSGLTDSAASATAMATGHKTWNGVIGMDRELNPVDNALELARAQGMATGVVSTDKLYGATPGAFTVHTPSRGDFQTIGEQQLASPPDVFLGGGRSILEPLFDGADVQLVRSAEELAAADLADPRPLVGLFAETTLSYLGEEPPDEEPGIAEMTERALERLSVDPEGFFLMVEGARIDHAGHINDAALAAQEVEAFDEAVASTLEWLAPYTGWTLIVTADHECGGLVLEGSAKPGEIPAHRWREEWLDHTNVDVPVYAAGTGVEALGAARLDNRWVHSVLSAVIEEREPVEPAAQRVPDGRTEDVGAVVSSQAWKTSFGVGYNQLDALRVGSDAAGLWIGVDGIAQRDANAMLVLIDTDRGAGRGLGADVRISDEEGALDQLLAAIELELQVEGVGFDLVAGTIGAREFRLAELIEEAGLRGVAPPRFPPADLPWLSAVANLDDGNLATESPAPDAGPTGSTVGGWELYLPWESLFPPSGLDAPAELAVAVALVNQTGSHWSNQALPPLPTADEPAAAPLALTQVVTLDVDADGTLTEGPALFP